MNINKPLAYIDFSIEKDQNGNNILYGTLRNNFYNEFFSNNALINGKVRAIHVDNAVSGKHGPRMKVYKDKTSGRSKPCISLFVDNGKVNNEGNKPRDIDMDTKEYSMYKDICLRNWELLCYCYNNDISADKAMERDEKRRNDPNNPISIKRDKNDGGFRYSEIRYDGPYGAKIKHNMVEYIDKDPIEEK